MRVKEILIGLFISVFVFTACSDEDETGNPRKEVKIQTSVNENANAPQLKASIDPATGSGNLENGDEITLSVWNGTSGAGRTYTIGTTNIYWDELIAHYGNVPLDFLAFYPNVGLFELQFGFNAATAANPDLLSAYAPGVSEGQTVNLAFNHIMHKLVVNLSSSDYTSSQLESAVVSLKNLKSTASVDTSNGTVDIYNASGTDAYPSQIGANTSFIVASQMLVPAAGLDLVEIAVDGKTFTYKIPADLNALLFESGKVLTLNLELKKGSGTVNGVFGEDYNPGGGTPWN